MPTDHEIATAYRHLYRWGLRAIQYSTPARFVLKGRIRQAFRTGKPEDFDHGKIKNTLEFLRGAAASTGMEHHIMRNLMLTWYWETEFWSAYRKDKQSVHFRQDAYEPFDHTIRMLNATMNMCLPHGDGHMLQRYAKITRGPQSYMRPDKNRRYGR